MDKWGKDHLPAADRNSGSQGIVEFNDIFKKSFIEGFTGTDISTSKIAATMLVTCILALYIFAMYRLVTRKTFYSKTFNIAIAIIW